MTRRNLASRCAGLVLAFAGLTGALAVEDPFCEPCCEHDMQMFAPVDFDFDCLPIQDECGYFFGYEKLSWAFTGERIPLGTGGTDDATLAPFRVFLAGHAGDTGVPQDPTALTRVGIAPPQLLGGIDSGPPRSSFAWGDRYEIGYFSGPAGWKVGVIDGPRAAGQQSYGLTTQNALYGSVMVVFDDPLNLMFGWIDVIDGVGGPFAPDGLADDIDADGHFGPDGYDQADPGRVPDAIFLPDQRGDFDDLVRLPTSWQFLTVRNATQTDGVEIMRTYQLSNLHRMVKHQNNDVEVGVGVRYLRLRDEFSVNGVGGVMGLSSWDTQVDNNIVGPQVSLKWTHRRRRIAFDLGGRFLFGYNIQNFEQDVQMGQDLIPGQYNRALYFVPTVSDHGKQENFFSPTAELRAEASYQLTGAFALKLGYTAIIVDNMSRAANQVRYELPRMGFRDDQAGEQEIFINGVNFGVEAVF